MGRRRTLLVLDGLEPLQHPAKSPVKGELKDPAIHALLRGLAAKNNGLCVVTTRDAADRSRQLARQRAAISAVEVVYGRWEWRCSRASGPTESAADLQAAVEEVKVTP